MGLTPTQGFGSGWDKGKNLCIKCGSDVLFTLRNARCTECGYTLTKKQYSNAKKVKKEKGLEEFI